MKYKYAFITSSSVICEIELNTLKTEGLMKNLEERITSHADLPWVRNYSGSFRPEGSPESTIEPEEIGTWLLIVVIFRWKGTTMDQTTDRLSGDPYTGVVRYSWIGPKETAPSDVSTADELDEWASLSVKYVFENTDVGLWGVHEGSWVEEVKEDGTVIVRDAKGRYEDESPKSLGDSRTVQLE